MENMILTLLSLSNKKQALCNDDYKDNTQTFIQEKKMNFVHVIMKPILEEVNWSSFFFARGKQTAQLPNLRHPVWESKDDLYKD